MKKLTLVLCLSLFFCTLTIAQSSQIDALKEEGNKQYKILVPKMKEALALGKITETLAIAKQIEAIGRPLYGDTSYVMANIWRAIYSPIYANLQNYRMVYFVNDSARRVLLALGDTLHPDYLGSLRVLSDVCEILNPPLKEEGLMYAEQLAQLVSLSKDPLAKVDGLMTLSRRGMIAGNYSKARKAFLQAGAILDTLRPYVYGIDGFSVDSTTLQWQRVFYQNALSTYLVSVGQTSDALITNEKALQDGNHLQHGARKILYETMQKRAAIFLILGQYDSAQVWIEKTLKRKELQHFADLTKQAKVFEGLAALGRQSGNNGSASIDFSSLTGSLRGGSDEFHVLKLLQLFGNLQRGDIANFRNELGLIKQAVKKDRLTDPFIESTSSLLEALFIEKSSSAGLSFAETLRISGDYFRNVVSQLPILGEAQQRQAMNLLPFFMDLPYGKLDNSVKPDSLKDLLYLHWQRKALVLNQWQGFRQKQKADTLLTSLTNHWQQTRSAYVRSISLGFSQKVVDSLKAQVDLLEANIAERRPLQLITPDTLKFLLSNLPKTAALVDFVRVQYKVAGLRDSLVYKAFVVNGQTKQVRIVHIGSEADLAPLFFDGKGQPFPAMQLVKAFYTEGQATAQKAYQWLWQPIEKHVQGAQEIYLSKAGILHQVAFGALANAKTRLLQRYTFHEGLHVPTMLAMANQKPSIHQAQVWGAIDYGKANAKIGNNSIAFIPTTLRPVEQLLQATDEPLSNLDAISMEPIATVLRKQGLQVEVYNGSKATETLFKVTAETVQGILHINTHGFYKPPSSGKSLLGNSGASEPLLNSGLALAGANQYWLTGSLQQGEEEDGLLTAYEIAQLNLSGLQLATLSACETALGQPTGEEGTLGLVRGLRIAGVPRVLASLWPVPAKATNELMLAFYRQWALLPNPAKALRHAQLALLAKGYPPFYWAGWVLVE